MGYAFERGPKAGDRPRQLAISGVLWKGAKTLGIINVVGSAIARQVDSGIYLHAGPEIGVASTKAFTCQITALLLLALYLAGGRRPTSYQLFELEKIPEKVREVSLHYF